MNKIFAYDSPLIKFLGVMADLMFVNIVHTLCCIPIITIGPAQTALYTVAVQWCEKETAGVKEYLIAFKQNFKSSFPLWLTLLPIGLFLAADIYLMILNQFPVEWLMWLLITPTAVFFVYSMSHLFLVEARFSCTYRQALKNSALMALAHPFCSIVNIALSAFPIVLYFTSPEIFFYAGPFWMFFYFSVFGYLSAGCARNPYNRMIQRMRERDEADNSAEASESAEIPENV